MTPFYTTSEWRKYCDMRQAQLNALPKELPPGKYEMRFIKNGWVLLSPDFDKRGWDYQ